MLQDDLVPIGGDIPTPRPPYFELVIEDHVAAVGSIEPVNYFVTSGDAVTKARVLERDLRQLAHRHPSLRVRALRQAERAAALVLALQEARGEAVFLETEWANHRLLCIPKNPRNRAEPGI